jgi:hypothetical protein
MSLRRKLYKVLRVMDDVDALRKGRVKHRVRRRLSSKIINKILKRIFK